MGMQNSKFGKELPNSELQEASVPSTPILTPNTIKAKEMDPRSPSLHIARTPLELLSAAAEKLEAYDCETPIRNKPLFLGVDPRSPTTDFKRTPIILNGAECDLPRKLHNKNLDKARFSEIATSVLPLSEKKSAIPPKLLESSPIKRKSDAYKRRSLVGLLETNIDFTETDLDKVMREKCKIDTAQTTTESEEDLKDNTEEDAISKTETCDTNSLVSESTIVEQNQIFENVEQCNISKIIELGQITVDRQNQISENVEQSDISKTVELDSEIPEVVEQSQISEIVEQNQVCTTVEQSHCSDIIKDDRKIEFISEDIKVNEKLYDIIDTNIDSQVKSNGQLTDEEKELNTAQLHIPNRTKSVPLSPIVPLNANVYKKEAKSEPVTPPFVNLTADLKQFDRKLQNLIYEDYDVVVCPRIVKIKENVERSPLKNCNGNEPKVKSTQKLKVSDKPRRSEYAVSKIPVFREKKNKLKNDVQCENTPPTNMDKKKVKVRKSDWDTKDTTLYL